MQPPQVASPSSNIRHHTADSLAGTTQPSAPPADPGSALDLFGPAEWLGSGTNPAASASESAPSRGTGQAHAAQLQQVLFIQMEFCPRTLRDVLDAGDMQPELSWKVLRQIAMGLAHIHGQGIIHRGAWWCVVVYIV